MSVQLDAQAEGTSYKESDGPFSQNFSNHSFLIGGHINWRNSQRGLLGVFAGAGDAGGGFDQARRHVVVGAEGQLYWNQFTLYVQGGYDTIVGDTIFDGEPHAWFVRGTGRYFFMPNTMIEGTVLYANGEIEFNASVFPVGFPSSQGFQTWLWEAKLEHRFATTPFSAFVKYRGSETKYDTVAFDGTLIRVQGYRSSCPGRPAAVHGPEHAAIQRPEWRDVGHHRSAEHPDRALDERSWRPGRAKHVPLLTIQSSRPKRAARFVMRPEHPHTASNPR